MTYQLGFETLKGTGIFSSGHYKLESRFIIQRQFSHTVLSIQDKPDTGTIFKQFNNSNPWALSGQLEDGRTVSASELMMADMLGAELVPLASVYIGKANLSSLLEVQYPLIGMFEGNVSIECSGWLIEIFESDQNNTFKKNCSKNWRIPLEGRVLRLSCEQKTIDEYHEKPHDIMMLLSLALGNGVTSYRHIINSEPQDVMEVWQKWTGDEFGPGPIIPTIVLGDFLSKVLSVWDRWESCKKSKVRLAITYINLSATGYLDTRLFQISQVWEFIATSWTSKGKLNDHESDLRKKIKASYRDWKEEYPKADPKGIWGGRVTFPFKWPLAKRQMESLANSNGIDFSKIKLNLEVLKKMRDSVAHNGKMTDQMNKDSFDSYQVLAAAQFGLQLILINEFGYSGLIFSSSNGRKRPVPIKEYYIS